MVVDVYVVVVVVVETIVSRNLKADESEKHKVKMCK